MAMLSGPLPSDDVGSGVCACSMSARMSACYYLLPPFIIAAERLISSLWPTTALPRTSQLATARGGAANGLHATWRSGGAQQLAPTHGPLSAESLRGVLGLPVLGLPVVMCRLAEGCDGVHHHSYVLHGCLCVCAHTCLCAVGGGWSHHEISMDANGRHLSVVERLSAGASRLQHAPEWASKSYDGLGQRLETLHYSAMKVHR
jgi:hypothetical protein